MSTESQTTRYVVQVAHKQGGSTRIVGDASLYDPRDLGAMQRLMTTFLWLNDDTIESFTVHLLRPDQLAHSADLSATETVTYG